MEGNLRKIHIVKKTKALYCFITLLLCNVALSGFFLGCKPSKEEQFRTYLREFRKFDARAQPFYNKLNALAKTLAFPKNTTLIFEYKPNPLLNMEMQTANVVWYQIEGSPEKSNFSPNFKISDLIPGGRSTFAITILNDIRSKLATDSLLLNDKDTSGLELFVSSLNTKQTPYAIFFRELKREDTEIAKRDFMDYSFGGGGIILAVWIADIDQQKIIGSYIKKVSPTQAYQISSLKDTISENEKMENMKLSIYREACFEAFKSIKEDIKKEQGSD